MINISKIRWEITSSCNLNCKHCFIANNRVLKTLKISDLKKIADNIYNLGIRYVSFTTKEPLIHPDIYDIINYCNSLGIYTSILSNGMLLNSEDQVLKLINSGLNNISISIEGISEESNDYIRGNGVLNNVLNVLRNIKKLKSEKTMSVGIQMSLNSLNITEVDNMIDFFNNLYIDNLSINDLLIDGNATQHEYLKLDRETFRKCYKKIIVQYQKLKVKNFNLMPREMLPYACIYYNLRYNTEFEPVSGKCSIIENVFSILSDGTLSPCIAINDKEILDKDVNIGNVLNLDSINFEKIENIKDNVYTFIKNKQNRCNECTFYKNCLLCPNTLKDETLYNDIRDECNLFKNKIDRYINKILLLYNKYIVCFSKNIYIKIDSNYNYILNKLYNNNISIEKNFKLTKNEINIIEEIYAAKNVGLHLSYIYYKYNLNVNIENLIRKLAINDFIRFKKI